MARRHLKARIQWRSLLPTLLALAFLGSTTQLEMILFVLLWCTRDSRQVDYLISLSKYCHCHKSFPLKKLRQCKYGLKAHLSYHILSSIECTLFSIENYAKLLKISACTLYLEGSIHQPYSQAKNSGKIAKWRCTLLYSIKCGSLQHGHWANLTVTAEQKRLHWPIARWAYLFVLTRIDQVPICHMGPRYI